MSGALALIIQLPATKRSWPPIKPHERRTVCTFGQRAPVSA
jgi:hypothetical protein